MYDKKIKISLGFLDYRLANSKSVGLFHEDIVLILIFYINTPCVLLYL